jgi:hypothetical protein
MYDFYDMFFFGQGNKKSLSDLGIQNKKWAGLLIFYRLLDLVMGRFDYKLPDTMDPRFLELSLLSGGEAVILKYMNEILNLRITAGNRISRYGYYNNFQAVDYMGKSYGYYIPDDPGNISPDCVSIKDKKKLTIPPMYRIKWYADRLTTIQGSINSCIANMRGSTIIQCQKEQEKPIKKAFQDAADGVPVILSFSEFEGGYSIEPKVISNPQSADLLRELQEAYDKTMADFLTEFGINANGVINKLAGVSGKELEQNAQSTEIALNAAYEARKDGLKRASEMFGTPMSVEIAFNNDLSNDNNNDIIKDDEEDEA